MQAPLYIPGDHNDYDRRRISTSSQTNYYDGDKIIIPKDYKK